MELLALAVQACFIIWGAGLTYLAAREIRRALAARRRRLAWWRDLLRSSRAASTLGGSGRE